jgi:hypothetical protein
MDFRLERSQFESPERGAIDPQILKKAIEPSPIAFFSNYTNHPEGREASTRPSALGLFGVSESGLGFANPAKLQTP